MAAIPPPEKLTPDELFTAIEQLPHDEADELTMRLVYLRARRRVPCLPEREAELLNSIYREKRPGFRERFDELRPKMLDRTLTSEEHEEFMCLAEEAEMFDARRLEALAELAMLRQKPLFELMKDLGLKAPDEV